MSLTMSMDSHWFGRHGLSSLAGSWICGILQSIRILVEGLGCRMILRDCLLRSSSRFKSASDLTELLSSMSGLQDTASSEVSLWELELG